MSNLQKFNETIEELNQEVTQLKEVSGAYKKLQKITEAVNETSKQFEENSKTFDKINVAQIAQHEIIGQSLIELEKSVENRAEIIRRENKEFYKELESTIKIKLDENKSQIRQLIENERSQIKQIFEIEFSKSTKELNHSFRTEIEKQTILLTENQKKIKTSLWLIGGINLVLLLVILFKIYSF